MYKLIFYVPICDAESVKNNIFKTGAGSIGNYSHCSWETKGVGQFMPNAGACPAIGQLDQIERVDELRVEILCEEANIELALEAMFEAHPYEEPAYEVISILNHKFRGKN